MGTRGVALRAAVLSFFLLPITVFSQTFPYFPPPGMGYVYVQSTSSTVTVGDSTTAGVLTSSTPASATAAGESLTVTSANGGATSGNGGALNLNSGAGVGSTSGVGGAINITAGNGSPNGTSSATAKGGGIAILGGNGGGTAGNQAGGNISVTAGNGSSTAATGIGGTLQFNGGTGKGLSSGAGGQISFTAGSSTVSGAGGGLTFTAGNGANTGAGGSFTGTAGTGGATGNGGNLTYNGGGGGATSGNGGNVNITSGPATSGNAGAINFSAGASAAGGSGGTITLTPGTGPTTASGGQTIIQSPGGNNTFIVDQFGNIICTCVTTTGATDGFSYLGAVSGTPTGVPAHITGAYANSIPIRYDTSNNNLWAYNSGWRSVVQPSQTITFQPGPLTAVSGTIESFAKITKASTVDNIEASALAFSCAANPTVTLYECGVSATCAGPTTIGTVTLTAPGQVFDGTVSSPGIAAGDYVAFSITAGTCANLNLTVNASAHAN